MEIQKNWWHYNRKVTWKNCFVDPFRLAPYAMPFVFPCSSWTVLKGKTFFSTVRKATNVPTYEATITIVKNHHTLVIIRGANALKTIIYKIILFFIMDKISRYSYAQEKSLEIESFLSFTIWNWYNMLSYIVPTGDRALPVIFVLTYVFMKKTNVCRGHSLSIWKNIQGIQKQTAINNTKYLHRGNFRSLLHNRTNDQPHRVGETELIVKFLRRLDARHWVLPLLVGDATDEDHRHTQSQLDQQHVIPHLIRLNGVMIRL